MGYGESRQFPWLRECPSAETRWGSSAPVGVIMLSVCPPILTSPLGDYDNIFACHIPFPL
ncbi:hypothetical protein MY8738_006310, partial [Beauveria namnaoensis]